MTTPQYPPPEVQPPQPSYLPPPPPPPVAKKKGGFVKKFALSLVAIVAVLMVIGMVSSALKGGTQTAAAPTVEAAPLSDQEQLQADLAAKLGESNRDGVERLAQVKLKGDALTVKWAINDNLTSDLLASGARKDVADILQVVKESSATVDTVTAVGTFSMVDKLGNASEDTVIKAKYSYDTIGSINFDNFDPDNVWDVADSADVHSELQ